MRELRLFISSTFRDLIEEREELLKKVFPLVRHTCRQRGVDFVEIDLRWGLTEQDTALGTVVRTCLEEIDRCRPFFLGILGTRYGWSPSFVDIQKDPQLLSRYPWIEEAAVEGASILDLEFTHALLNRAPEIGSFVYRRTSEPESEDAEKLSQLASRIERAGVDIRSFDSVDALGRLVLEDLMSAINHYWPEIQSDDFLEHERREQAAFAATRRKAYIANAESLKKLTAHVAPGAGPLLLSAASGQGKSALLAYWSDFIKRKQPDAIILTHFVGLSTAGSGAPAILRHFIEELRSELGDGPEKLGVESVESEFRILLSRITDRPLVFIIDAVNQLDEQWHSMDWLPDTEGQNIHWIVSTTGGRTREALQQRGWETYYLGELDIKEREALVVRFLGDFRKVLTAEQLQRITRCDNSASPLFLRTLLEELRLFGNFEALDQVIDEYLVVPDLAGLFQKVLARMQEDFGALRVREILTLVWGARKGLTELELVELTGIAKPKLTKFLLALEYQLLPRSGFITLFHDYLAEAIERAYLPSDVHKKKLHDRLAKYFDEKELNERNAYEALWQLAQAGQVDRIRKLLVSPLHFRFFMTDERKWEYLRYWRLIDKDRELALELASHLRAAADQGYSHEEERIEQVAVGASFLHEIGQPQLALELAEFAEHKLAEPPESFQSLRIQLLGIKGQAYQALSEYSKAEEAFELQIAEAEAMEGLQSAALSEALDNLAYIQYTRGAYNDAALTARRSLAIKEHIGSDAARASAMLGLGAILQAKSELADAESVIHGALKLASEQTRPDLIAQAYNSLSAIYVGMGALDRAVEANKESFRISKQLYGLHHTETIIRIQNLGYCLSQLHRYDEAVEHYRLALKLVEETLGAESSLTADVLSNLASTEAEQGNLDQAHADITECLRIRKKILKDFDLKIVLASCTLANILLKRGQASEAMTIYRIYVPYLKTELGIRHPLVLKVMERYSSAVGDLERTVDDCLHTLHEST